LVIKILISLFFLLSLVEVFAQDSLGYYHGKASYYNFKGHGNCSYKSPSKPVLTAAVNTKQYNSAMLCGACLQVIGSKDTIIVHVEDRCPGCKFGGIDLSKAAFAKANEISKGRAEVRWKVVPCGYLQSMKLFVRKTYNDGSATIILTNHNTPLKSLFVWNDTTWIPVDREKDNCFHVRKKKDGLVRLQMSDWYGNQVVVDSLTLMPGTLIDLKHQFGKLYYVNLPF